MLGGIRMRKIASPLSIVVLLFGIFSVSLARNYDFFKDHYVGAVISSIIIAFFLALISEKGIWRKIALWLIVIAVLLIIFFFVLMGVLWNKP
jgi:cell division protein FtsW (lipid II flippase)